MVNYQAYIQELVELGDIMTKRFFIVVPYSPLEEKATGFWARAGALFTPGRVIRLNQEKFDKYQHNLFQRIEHVKMHITSLGLEAAVLDTQSLIELYYNVYNPEISTKQKMTNVEKLKIEEWFLSH